MMDNNHLIFSEGEDKEVLEKISIDTLPVKALGIMCFIFSIVIFMVIFIDKFQWIFVIVFIANIFFLLKAIHWIIEGFFWIPPKIFNDRIEVFDTRYNICLTRKKGRHQFKYTDIKKFKIIKYEYDFINYPGELYSVDIEIHTIHDKMIDSNRIKDIESFINAIKQRGIEVELETINGT